MGIGSCYPQTIEKEQKLVRLGLARLGRPGWLGGGWDLRRCFSARRTMPKLRATLVDGLLFTQSLEGVKSKFNADTNKQEC